MANYPAAEGAATVAEISQALSTLPFSCHCRLVKLVVRMSASFGKEASSQMGIFAKIAHSYQIISDCNSVAQFQRLMQMMP